MANDGRSLTGLTPEEAEAVFLRPSSKGDDVRESFSDDAGGELVTVDEALARMDPALRKTRPDADWLAMFRARPATYGIKTLGDRATGSSRRLSVVDFSTLIEYELPARALLLDPLIIEQGLTMLHAWRGLGKTQVAMGAAMAIATGTAFLRWTAPCPQPVLYVDGELPLRVLQDRVKAARERAGVAPAPGYLRFITPDLLGRAAPDLADMNDQELLDAAVGDAKLIVLDNLSCLLRSGAAENDAESWVLVSDWLLQHRAAGRAVLIVHHSGKNGGQRGTSRREDLLDVVIALRKPKEWEAKDGARFEVHFEKGRHLTGDQMQPFEAMLDDAVPGGWTMADLEDSVDEQIVERLALRLSLTEIARELGLHKSTVSRRVQALREAGVLPPEGEKVRNTTRNRDQKGLL